MRFSRLYEQTAEFRSRCKAFDFAAVAHAVLDLAVDAKKRLIEMKKALFKGFSSFKKPVAKKPHQLILELDGLEQIPLFYQ